MVEPQAIEVKDVASFLKVQTIDSTLVQVLGDGLDVYAKDLGSGSEFHFHRPQKPKDHPLAETLLVKLGQLQHQDEKTVSWQSVVPVYIRASAAEENLKLKN